MSFQAYLDAVQAKTGKTPSDLIEEAKEERLTKSDEIVAWLKNEYGLGLGHARAVAYVIQHGAEFVVHHKTGTHRDVSGTLILDGSSLRKREGRA